MNKFEDGKNVFGYAPFSADLSRPGDRRRFPAYARKIQRNFELVESWNNNKVIVVSSSADLQTWQKAPKEKIIVFDIPDALLEETSTMRSAFRGVGKWLVGANKKPAFNYRSTLLKMAERSDAVICSTPEQSERFLQHNSNVHTVLDFHGEFQIYEAFKTNKGGRFDIVWEGLGYTLTAMKQVVEAVTRIGEDLEIGLHVVTDRRTPRFMDQYALRDTAVQLGTWAHPISVYQWDLRTFPSIARSCDVAVVPVDLKDSYARAKPENRMRLFWRLGMPVIASATPAHMRAFQIAGMSSRALCHSVDDWVEAITYFGNDRQALFDLSRLGQKAALGAYSEDGLTKLWDGVFESVGAV